MANLLDFIHWRGDLSFSIVPVGEVDGLILSELSMCRWENGMRETDTALLKDIAIDSEIEPVSVGFTEDNDKKLLESIRDSERYGGVRISDYVKRTDETAEMQFGALTLHLADGTRFVAYRGTDRSFVGWKEDCNMAFSKPIPAQEAATKYIEYIAETYPGPLLVGGHSKGGNLAMYAAATAEESVRARIRAVYNYDGPGLSDMIDAPGLYARITGRLHSFVPQGSIVGLLLAHPDQYTVVKSTGIGILQHDPYTWQVDGPRFMRMNGLSDESARFDIAFRKWIAQMDETERAELVDALFSVLSASKVQSFGKELWLSMAQNPKAVLTAIGQVNAETRKKVAKLISDFGKLAVQPRLQ